ncbi:heat shock protein DnaJ domain protein [Rippkaea orientalis PCC 8801]|uniref:Heat shock protein DnaJ domain protein n=1 Tax=Rippkaea orientalis (strain PCC 8801 / RF-1) TaxID=41431 RepID=B7K444_RIPO1|nr:J domain-containing protein [Rippkaea orientalis]ACK67750.1 heat shock protein DnaJ domain protein [Rippkaea orientalis PCC 8801]
MTEQQTKARSTSRKIPPQTRFANSYYAILGLHPSASVIEIRRAYRQLSKQYHPDTTTLPTEVATSHFQRLNEAYGTLSNPERRSLYDLKIGYSRWNVIQTPPQSPPQSSQESHSAYLDPNDRPLSSGEIFALLILGLTLVGCLMLAIAIAILRGDDILPQTALPSAYSSLPWFMAFLCP